MIQDNLNFNQLVELFVKPCYYSLENDKQYQNIHFIKRKLFLNKFRHDNSYVKKVEQNTNRTRDELYKESVECILFVRDIIKRELEKIVEIAKKNKNDIPTDLEDQLLKILNKEINQKYDSIIF